MGTDPATSVCDSFGRTHDHENLFVIGAPTLPTGGCTNGTLTFVAVSLRSADEARGGLKGSGIFCFCRPADWAQRQATKRCNRLLPIAVAYWVITTQHLAKSREFDLGFWPIDNFNPIWGSQYWPWCERNGIAEFERSNQT